MRERLTQEAAAKYLGLRPGTLANWRARGYGPYFVKIGRRVEYLMEDLEAWENAQRTQPVPKSPKTATPRRRRPSRELLEQVLGMYDKGGIVAVEAGTGYSESYCFKLLRKARQEVAP